MDEYYEDPDEDDEDEDATHEDKGKMEIDIPMALALDVDTPIVVPLVCLALPTARQEQSHAQSTVIVKPSTTKMLSQCGFRPTRKTQDHKSQDDSVEFSLNSLVQSARSTTTTRPWALVSWLWTRASLRWTQERESRVCKKQQEPT
jgi:hypothetical protein